MNSFWDQDIQLLDLSDFEKNGLQVFRNYQNAFDKFAIKQFRDSIKIENYRLGPVESVLDHIKGEGLRFLPVIACAFADDEIEQMFRREILGDVIGGLSTMFNGFGSLSNFSQRLQICHAFGWMSSDLLEEFNKLRKVRNDISHSWDVNKTTKKLQNFILEEMNPIEIQLSDGNHIGSDLWKTLPFELKFRIRIIWMVGRFYYDSHLFPRTVKQRMNPITALYGGKANCLLIEISRLCVGASKSVADLTKTT